MKLKQFVVQLQNLVAEGHGNLDVYYTHSASGDCGALNNARVTDHIDEETGPFDLETGEKYISISAGN